MRLVGPDNEQVGIVSLDEALRRAYDADLDLVEVAPQATPPVCRIMDYGKYKYQMKKKMQEAKKKQVQIQIKEVKFRPKTDEHDIQIKVKNIKRFLADGNKVDVRVVFRGREMAHIESGQRVIERILELVGEDGLVEVAPKMEGRMMYMRLAPVKQKGGKK